MFYELNKELEETLDVSGIEDFQEQLITLGLYNFNQYRSSSSDKLPNNEIWYTSTDGNIVDIPDLSALGGTYVGPEMISNTYENGKGVMKFAEDITWMGFDLSAGLGYGIIFINSEPLGGTCPKIKTISLPDSVTELKSEYISGVGNVTTFLGNYNLEEVSLSNCITEIGNYAFSHCSSLISITIPEGVTSIGLRAFYYCSSLTSVILPESVTSIGDYAFNGCSSLISITIPEGVTSIGNQAFYDCSSLASIIFEGTVSQWNNVSLGELWYYGGTAEVVKCTDGEVAIQI